MAKIAYVEDSIVVGVYDQLPTNWKNISNFFTLEGEVEYLKTLGWLPIIKRETTYDPATQCKGAFNYTVEGDQVIESNYIVDKPSPPTDEEIAAALANQWIAIRNQRDLLMQQTDWRYTRYEREVRLQISPTDTLENLDTYMQSLANITEQTDPYNISWPTL